MIIEGTEGIISAGTQLATGGRFVMCFIKQTLYMCTSVNKMGDTVPNRCER